MPVISSRIAVTVEFDGAFMSAALWSAVMSMRSVLSIGPSPVKEMLTPSRMSLAILHRDNQYPQLAGRPLPGGTIQTVCSALLLPARNYIKRASIVDDSGGGGNPEIQPRLVLSQTKRSLHPALLRSVTSVVMWAVRDRFDRPHRRLGTSELRPSADLPVGRSPQVSSSITRPTEALLDRSFEVRLTAQFR